MSVAGSGGTGGGRIGALLDALDAVGGSAERSELLAALRRRWPQLRPAQLDRLLADAAGEVELVDGRYRRTRARPGTSSGAPARNGPLRAVAVDLEALVKPVAEAPYLARAIWQVGAVRFGGDRAWVNADPRFLGWPDIGDGFEFTDAERAERHRSACQPVGEVLAALAAFCDGSDMLVAYNGTGMDFGVLDAAFDTAGLVRLGQARADGLYLAYCWWPDSAVGHRLRPLAEHVGVDVEGLRWHDAADDAELLARLIFYGATTVTAAWDVGLARIVASTNRMSPAWDLAFDLAGVDVERAALDDDDVAGAIEAVLAGRPRRRGRPVPAPLQIPGAWVGASGRVEPFLLSQAINPQAERRAAQDEMADAVADAVAAGEDLAVEAPTGTGKSLAALAAGVDWLAGGPARRVIIATHTKQLQRQLAGDIDALAAGAPQLLSHTSLVKGAANRLSLRALVGILADLSAGEAAGVLAEPAFAELATYLLCRLCANPGGLLGEAEALSVDTADVPAFFEEYSARRWLAYLSVASQAAAGDYETGGGLGDHTVSVREALAGAQLVVANHALLFAHLDDLADIGGDTLLIVDEAHAAESAATDALGWAFSYPQLELAARQLAVWGRRPDAGDAVRGSAHRLEELLQRERVARAAMDAADALAGPIADGWARQAALVSPFTGDVAAVPVRRLLSDMGALARTLDGARRALAGWFGEHRQGLSRRDRHRLFELRRRLDALANAAVGVVGDADLVGGTSYLTGEPAGGRPAAPAGRSGAQAGSSVGSGAANAGADAGSAAGGLDDLDTDFGGASDTEQGDTEPGDIEPGDIEPGDIEPGDAEPGDAGGGEDGTGIPEVAGADGGAAAGGGASPAAGGGNRVVWMAEQSGSQLAAGARGYRFEVRSSPIRLAVDAGWERFRATFARTVFTSATLTVAGGWDYLTDRLGLGAVRHLCLDGPFDYARQAQLVCFNDFPSWAEHTEAAMRTIAWQLTGYGREATIAGRQPGAMVLTTATSTASGVAEHLGTYSAEAGLSVPLAAAPVVGNARAVEQMNSVGGWLVGTKGLWAGVNISGPDRARICWINKLPFAPFADPIVSARRAEVAARAEAAGHPDPDVAATEGYYLPLAAMELRQAAGRLIRSSAHRGVIVISDRKLAGAASRRRTYRRILLGSLDRGLLRKSADGDIGGDNITTMAEGWERIWRFLADGADIDPDRVDALCQPDALDEQTLLPQTRRIRALALTPAEIDAHRHAGTLEAEVVARAGEIGGLLRFSDTPIALKSRQAEAIAAAARGDDLLALLPTGYGKSFCFQLPALAMPGVTVVVSPLVALMADQALELNRAIGGAVRALVAPLAESSSRAGRQEVAEQLTGVADNGIRLVYVSPERFAHRQFRDWVDAAVDGGRLARIAIDEAHCLATWGDDFRPSYRRFSRHLAGLRARGVPVSALTATANRSVREALRTQLFALPATPTSAEPDPASFAQVTAEVIRPELALYRLALRAGGPVSLARHLEAAYDAAASSSAGGHAIFYCLTVREVNATWAHLRDYAGPAAAVRVRRFHGRLSEAEKASVLGDFRDAPRRGDDDFAPMVVVATSAFGLGINRDDISTVFVTSPPTDLAALYQQLGRAGRGRAGTIPAEGDDASVGVALATGRGFRTVEFLTRDLPFDVLSASAAAVLRCGGVLDATAVSERIVDARVRAGALSVADALNDNVRSAYRTAAIRALAALADAGAVDDLGDFPATVALARGEAIAGADDPVGAALVGWVAAQGGRARSASVLAVHGFLSGAGLVEADDPAATWAALVDAHHGGILDVSQAPNRRWLTALRVNQADVPASFAGTVTARSRRAGDELGALRAWYADTHRCANQGIADYFAADGHGQVPAGTCSTSPCRCSTHWASATGGTRPAMLDALLHPPARPASASDDRARAARLDADVARLITDNPYGVGARSVYYCLRGKDRVPDGAGGLRPIRSGLYYHRLFGSRPALRWPAVEASLARLEAAGTVVAVERRWRSAVVVAAEAARAAQGAVAGAQP